MDFVTHLPVSTRGYDAIFSIIDRFSDLVDLYHVILQCLLWNVLNFFGNIGCVDLVCRIRLFLIEMLSLLVVFGRSCASYWNVVLLYLLLIILKLMD
jgi:hypothetical protein